MKRLAIVLALTLCGCATNLQEPYVAAMEATYTAVQADVKAGLYKPDGASQTTLKKWDKANKDARAALEANDKKEAAK